LGKIFMGSVSTKWQRTQENYDNPPWKKTFQSAGGGVLIMQAIHNIDILQWLMGSVEFVYGKSGIYTHDIEVEDVAVAMLQFENGALGVIEATTSVQRTIPNRLEIHGDLGSVVIGGNIKTKQRNRMVGRLPWVKGSLTMQLEDFINAIIEDRTPFVNGKEGRKTLAIINAIYESNRIGRPVFLIQGGCVL
jgi:predicted dehydrogenase